MHSATVLQKQRKELIKKFKQTNTNTALRCPACRTAMSYIHIDRDANWKCPKCKTITSYHQVIKDKKVSGGYRRRTLSDDKIIKHNEIGAILSSKFPDALSQYSLGMKAFRHYKMFAFCALLYLTGSRVSEITGVKHPEKEDIWIVKPLIRSQISLEKTENDMIIRINDLIVLKTRPEIINDEVKLKKYPKRSLKLVYDYDSNIFPFVAKYLEIMDKKYQGQDYILFDICRQTGWRYVQQVFDKKIYSHWLRHSRYTNISQDMQFNELMLQQFAGWKTTKMASQYVHLTPDLLYDAMRQRYKKNN
jgi:integrase